MAAGHGAKYVTLKDEKKAHIYAEGEWTRCGIPVPIAGGAEWTWTEAEKLCPDCEKIQKKVDKMPFDQRAPFDEGVALMSEDPANVAALESVQPEAEAASAPKATARKADVEPAKKATKAK